MYNVCKHIYFLNHLFTFIFKVGYSALNVYFNLIYSIIKVRFTNNCLVNTPDSYFWEMWCQNKPDLLRFDLLRTATHSDIDERLGEGEVPWQDDCSCLTVSVVTAGSDMMPGKRRAQKRRWLDNIRNELLDIELSGGGGAAQDLGKWRGLVRTIDPT